MAVSGEWRSRRCRAYLALFFCCGRSRQSALSHCTAPLLLCFG
jgi:hypothetical protein